MKINKNKHPVEASVNSDRQETANIVYEEVKDLIHKAAVKLSAYANKVDDIAEKNYASDRIADLGVILLDIKEHK